MLVNGQHIFEYGQLVVMASIDTNFSSQEQLLADLIYIEQIQCQNTTLYANRIQIYRFQQAPYDYVMKHKKLFLENNVRTIAINLNHRSIARIHNIKIFKENKMCIKQIYVQCYVNYYCLNLQQVIYQRKKDDVRFTTGQMWYILKGLLDLACYLNENRIVYGAYMPKNIYLSAQGYLKVYLFHLLSNNQHSVFYRMNNQQRDIFKNLPIAPQILPFLLTHNYEKTFDLLKIDIFDIGMILLEMMLHGSIKKYYTLDTQDNIMFFNTQLLKKDIIELKNIYPINLINMIEKMLVFQPKQRATLKQLNHLFLQIRQNISISGSIKMFEDEQNQIEPKVSFKDIFGEKESKIHHILQSINNNDKLQVCAINGASLEPAKRNYGVNLTNRNSNCKPQKSTISSLSKPKIMNIQLCSSNKTHQL